jgi:hypothetical protein
MVQFVEELRIDPNTGLYTIGCTLTQSYPSLSLLDICSPLPYIVAGYSESPPDARSSFTEATSTGTYWLGRPSSLSERANGLYLRLRESALSRVTGRTLPGQYLSDAWFMIGLLVCAGLNVVDPQSSADGSTPISYIEVASPGDSLADSARRAPSSAIGQESAKHPHGADSSYSMTFFLKDIGGGTAWSRNRFASSSVAAIESLLSANLELRQPILRALITPVSPDSFLRPIFSRQQFSSEIQRLSRMAPFQEMSLSAACYRDYYYSPTDPRMKLFQVDAFTFARWLFSFIW